MSEFTEVLAEDELSLSTGSPNQELWNGIQSTLDVLCQQCVNAMVAAESLVAGIRLC